MRLINALAPKLNVIHLFFTRATQLFERLLYAYHFHIS